MTSMFNEMDLRKLPKDARSLETLREFAETLSGECGRKLPPKYRYYHTLRAIVGVENMYSLFNRRAEFIYSLYHDVFRRD